MTPVIKIHQQNQEARNEVASSVNAFIARAGVSKSAVAREIGMAQSTFSRRTTGAEPFDIDELGQLADYFSVTLIELISGEITKIAPNAKKAPTRESEDYGAAYQDRTGAYSLQGSRLAEIIPFRRVS